MLKLCYDGTDFGLATINPLMYRSYYLDVETGYHFYYLNSRYYMADLGRFVSADTTDILSVQSDLYDKNLFAYCDNNPVHRVDTTGFVWETVFDVVSLGFSIAEVAMNPYDITAWVGLVGDAVDLIPFVTGVGEVVKGVRFVDKVGNTLEITKAVDFTDDAIDTIKTLDRSSGFTKSTKIDGINIHKGYKKGTGFLSDFKEYKEIPGIRPDYYDGKTIFELKPFNSRSAKAGVKQLKKYNSLLGANNILRLEFY